MQACLCMCVHADTKLWVLISIPGKKEKFKQRGFPWAKGTKQRSFEELAKVERLLCLQSQVWSTREKGKLHGCCLPSPGGNHAAPGTQVGIVCYKASPSTSPVPSTKISSFSLNPGRCCSFLLWTGKSLPLKNKAKQKRQLRLLQMRLVVEHIRDQKEQAKFELL